MTELPKWRKDPAREEQNRRASRSEELIRGVGGDVLPSLPLIESVADARLRAASSVAHRVLCLATVSALASAELEYEELVEWARKEPFWLEFSKRELEFLAEREAPEDERFHMSWQIEAAAPLIWALGSPIELGMRLDERPPGEVLNHLPSTGESTASFIKLARLRGTSEILDECDLIYRVHWAARNEQLGGKPTPEDWCYDVIMERHKALNWLICYGEDDSEGDWDIVGTDT